MSWLFSRALAAEYLEASSLDGEQFAPSSGTPTPQAFLCNGKTTAVWKRFPSGMTSNLLTDDRGEALLKWYREGFLAQTLVVPEKARASTEKQVPCGSTWRELSVRFDRNTSSWKTHRCLFDEDLPESSVTLPKWGMIRRGELWERIIYQTQTTTEKGFGFWPTPVTSECRDTWAKPHALAKLYKGDRVARFLCKNWLIYNLPERVALNPCWQEERMMWPIGWTGLQPLETDKFRQWCDSHGICLEGQSDET